MNNLSVIVLTHNDESRIVDCLESLSFAGEIIVVDDDSSDRTIELVEKYTKNIHIKKLDGNFSSQRNYALNYVHNSWVLFVDSDELVSQKLKDEILRAIDSSQYSGFYINRLDFMWGKKILHGEAGRVSLLRLAKKDRGKWHGKVHEVWKVNGKLSELVSPLIHVPHQSVREFVADIDEYSTLRADELRELGVSSNFITIIIYPVLKFIRNYIFKKGYKDGIPGFLYAMMMSFHSFLVRAKLYLVNNNG